MDWTDGLDRWTRLVDCESDTYPEQFCTEKGLLHWLVSLLSESPWRMRTMKIRNSYGVICHQKRHIFLNQ